MANPWLTYVVVPVASGVLGGIIGAALMPGAPAPPAPSESSTELRELHHKLDALRADIAALSVPSSSGGVRAPAYVPPPPQDAAVSPETLQLLLDAEALRKDALAKGKAAMEKMAALEARQVERKSARAADDLAELKTVQQNITPEETRKNVERWIKPLGFKDVDQQKIAEVSVGYVRARTDAIMALLEQAAQGKPPSREDSNQRLKPLEDDLVNALPGHLDPAAKAAVLAKIHERVKLPYYID